jgi:hypothetical protein
LCFWFAQMMRTTPWRRTTLHFTQIFFTDERTFIRVLAPRFASLTRLAESESRLGGAGNAPLRTTTPMNGPS